MANSNRMNRANTYKVPKRQWSKWCDLSRITFNEMYGMMSMNQELFLWPGDKPRTKRRWLTACWNAAWVAADAVKDGLKDIEKHG